MKLMPTKVSELQVGDKCANFNYSVVPNWEVTFIKSSDIPDHLYMEWDILPNRDSSGGLHIYKERIVYTDGLNLTQTYSAFKDYLK